MRSRRKNLVLSAVVALNFTTFAVAAEPDILLRTGIQSFRAGRYDESLQALKQAHDAQPRDAFVNLWYGLALQANKQPYEAMAVWREGYGNPKWEPYSDYLKALSWWQMGSARDAKIYMQDALVNLKDSRKVSFPPASAALLQLEKGVSAPPVGKWPEIAGLPTTLEETPDEQVASTRAKEKPVTKAPLKDPKPKVVQAPTPRPAASNIAYRPWAPLGTYKVGERVRFRVADNSWRTGVITAVKTNGASYERGKYMILEDNDPRPHPQYVYFSDVAGMERRDFWSGFFVGTWNLGSGMAINERVEGNNSRNEVLYVSSSEVLRVNPDNTYVWTADKKRITGRWVAQKDFPGIKILKGVDGDDYNFYNITDDATTQYMKEHHARLKSGGKMSILARRRIP